MPKKSQKKSKKKTAKRARPATSSTRMADYIPPRRTKDTKRLSGTLAIVGRPNVGKSTLFNRLIGRRRAIVGDEPGITRDRIYGELDWNGRTLRVIDTGGIVPDDKELIPTEIYRQAAVGMEEADAIIMVVDGRSEMTSPDIELARILLRGGKPLFLAVNKMDTPKLEPRIEEFRRLGIREVVAISAEHGNGLGDLLDEVLKVVPEPPQTEEEPAEATVAIGMGKRRQEQPEEQQEEQEDSPAAGDPERGQQGEGAQAEQEQAEQEQEEQEQEEQALETKVAIIGRPNVGKSTLLNRLTGSARAIVSPIAGTTRDAVDEIVQRDGQTFRFIDTAGIRRKGKTHLMAEKLSIVMARQHLESADVALLVIDATDGVTAIDATIGGYAHESGRSVLIVINKWDLVSAGRQDGKPPADRNIYEENIRNALKYLSYAPIIFISAASGKNVDKLFEQIEFVALERRKRITTGAMNRFLKVVDFERASVPAANQVRVFYMTQAAVAPPTFILFTDRDVPLHFSYQRFLENQIRKAFGFVGTPIWIKNRPRGK